MTHTRPRLYFGHLISSVAFVVLTLWCFMASAQERSPNLLDNLFNRGERASPPSEVPGAQSQSAQTESADLSVRLDRMENALRQLTGTIEQLQYRNQQLEIQLKRLQDDSESRSQQPNTKGAASAAPAPMNVPAVAVPDRRGDAFDPAQHPNAPGAPLDLSTSARTTEVPASSNQEAPSAAQPRPLTQNGNAGGTQLATLPPSARPQDEYDLAYGYVLHKDYALAEQAFHDFLAKYPNEHLVPDAQYWLGEALFQSQRYREAAESFLTVSTKYDHASKAPESLLRLGQSLAALKNKDAACATFAEIDRKYPHASASVRRNAAQEIKRAHC
jgi:tol-pal system protein YbgF